MTPPSSPPSSGQLWLRRGWSQQMDLQLTGLLLIVFIIPTLKGTFHPSICLTRSWHHITAIILISFFRYTSTYIGQIPEPTPSLCQTTRSNFAQILDHNKKHYYQMDQDCDDANANGNEANSRVVNYNMGIMVSIRVGNELLWCRTAWRNQEQLHFTLEKGRSLLFYQHNIHL